MKKLLVLMLSFALLVGCGAPGVTAGTTDGGAATDTTAREQSATDTARALLDGLKWRDKLELLDDDMRAVIIAAEDADIAQSAVYIGSGATAEEIAVLQCSGEDAAERVLEAVKTRVAEQIEAFRGYVPAEVPVLEHAVTERHGTTVVMVVCDDAQAALDIIGSLLP